MGRITIGEKVVKMEFVTIKTDRFDELVELQIAYKVEISEEAPAVIDFYILPAYRHKEIARKLVAYAYRESKVHSLCVGCADCDLGMYQAIGFDVPIGNILIKNSEL